MHAIRTIGATARLIAAGVTLQLAAVAANAAVISTTPTLPLLGVPYTSAVGAGCFPVAGVCIDPGTLTLTAPVSVHFDPAGQNIDTGATYTGVATDLSHTPIGTVTLTGSIDQEILGRTFSTETGTWSTEIEALSLSGVLSIPGLLDGHTLTLALSSSPSSTGTTSITPIGGGSNDQGGLFSISSFFDVFVDLSVDTTIPLHATRGPLEFTATAPVPEPAGLLLLGGGLIALSAVRRRF